MAEALRLDRVRAGYGETVVLEDVGFTLAERSSLAVLGRNGVGKTTLLATIMGHTTFHSGEMAFRGQPLARMPAFERNRAGIGYVPQAREVFPSLTVEENLTVAGRAGPWTLERVYEFFPRLAERRSHMGIVPRGEASCMRGRSLSGGTGSTIGRSSFGCGSGGFSTGYGLPGSSAGGCGGWTGSFAMHLQRCERRQSFLVLLRAAPTVSAMTAPRVPSGLVRPTVVSRAV